MPDERKRKFNEKGETQVPLFLTEKSFNEAWSYINKYNEKPDRVGNMTMSSLLRMSMIDYMKNNPL